MIIIPRIARKNLNTPFLHVMVQGVNKEYIFENDEYKEKYLKIINESRINCSFTLISHCVMSNHSHFITYAENIEEFAKFMHKSNLLYAQMYNREKKRVGVLFRNRYRVEPIYDIKYLINCIKYIHNNPIKAKMVSKCEDYKYSSYNDYINNTGVTKSEIMEKIFGKQCDYAKLFKQTFEKKLIDVDDDEEMTAEYIKEGIKGYQKEYSTCIIDIFSNRETLKKLVSYLKEEWNFKYVEIKKFFEIPRGTMESLKKN